MAWRGSNHNTTLRTLPVMAKGKTQLTGARRAMSTARRRTKAHTKDHRACGRCGESSHHASREGILQPAAISLKRAVSVTTKRSRSEMNSPSKPQPGFRGRPATAEPSCNATVCGLTVIREGICRANEAGRVPPHRPWLVKCALPCDTNSRISASSWRSPRRRI